ncbi:MAG TPA: hypothetical protein VFQ53_26930 [Kofleriaceae bacterium]|nr:hypothetical protein [Kofleriaceae bacterium]
MRAAALLVIVACSSGATPSTPRTLPAPPVHTVPVAIATQSCSHAAAGIERGTRALREPDESVLAPMRQRCTEDGWNDVAIDCFAKMKDDDLGRCANLLDKTARERMFGVLVGHAPNRASIAVASARLSTLKVGIAECDQFVVTVANLLACEGMSVETRVELGNETADFWSLPTDRLSEDALRRMAMVCGQSLTELQHRATDAGCMP